MFLHIITDDEAPPRHERPQRLRVQLLAAPSIWNPSSDSTLRYAAYVDDGLGYTPARPQAPRPDFWFIRVMRRDTDGAGNVGGINGVIPEIESSMLRLVAKKL